MWRLTFLFLFLHIPSSSGNICTCPLSFIQFLNGRNCHNLIVEPVYPIEILMLFASSLQDRSFSFFFCMISRVMKPFPHVSLAL